MARLTLIWMRRLPAVTALAAAALIPAAPAAAGAGFGAHAWGGPRIDAGNWAGYAASGGTFTTVRGTWVEPRATCTAAHDLYAPWLGLDGYGDQTVEQTGVQTSCSTGSPVDSGWYEMYPSPPVYFSNPVSAGDTIKASVSYAGGTSYTLTLRDVTKGWAKTEHRTLSAANASAEAIIEAPGGFPALPNGVTFTGVTVNGHPLGFYHPHKLTSDAFVPGPLRGGTFTITHT